jgi:hypothetical protein
MTSLVRDAFCPIESITGVTAIDATADTISINGKPITFECVTGNIWINPLAVAVAGATALKLTAGQAIDLVVMGDLSIISDGSGGTYQLIVWDM